MPIMQNEKQGIPKEQVEKLKKLQDKTANERTKELIDQKLANNNKPFNK